MMNAIPATLSSRMPVAHPTSRVKIPIAIISRDTVREIGLTFTDMFGLPVQSVQLNNYQMTSALS